MKGIEQLEKQIASYRDIYNQRKGQERQLKQDLENIKTELDAITTEQENLQEIRVLLQEASNFAREQSRQQVEYMVTQALQYVFGPEIEFEIRMEELRKRIEADFLVSSTYSKDYVVTTRPQDARGGGVVDIISLALRLSLLQSFRPAIEGPIILDEPAKHVSEDYISSVASFLKEFSSSFNRQVILVTHNDQLTFSGDKVFIVEFKDSKSVVKEQFS